MINAILTGVFNIMNTLIGILLTPINNLIFTLIPDFADLLSYFYSFCNQAVTYFGWLVDLLGLYSNVIQFIILYYSFKLTLPLLISGIKTIIKWYNALKV